MSKEKTGKNAAASEVGGEESRIISIREAQEYVYYDHGGPEDWNDLAEATYYGEYGVYGGWAPATKLIREIEEALHTDKNVLLVGDAGHGKSTLVKKVLHELTVRGDSPMKLVTGYLNLRAYPPIGGGTRFFNRVNDILGKMVQRLGGRLPVNVADLPVDEAFKKLVATVCRLDTKDLLKQQTGAVMVVDDVDYLEAKFHRPMLAVLDELMHSQNVTVVWACRPPAFAELEYEFSDRAKSAFVGIDPIEVQAPTLRTLFVLRLWPFLDMRKCYPDIRGIVREAEKSASHRRLKELIVADWRRRTGKRIRLSSIPYPLGERQENYIALTSNRDIRMAMAMVDRIVQAVYSQRKKYEPEVDAAGEVAPIDIHRTDFLPILGMLERKKNPVLPERQKELWRVLNLFEVTDNSGRAPLYVNVLQWVVVGDQRFGDAYTDAMSHLGFTKDQAVVGWQFCSNARLIEPVAILTGSFPLGEERSAKDWTWQLTVKGSFYLREVIEWEHYIYNQGFVQYPCLFSTLRESRLLYDCVNFLVHLCEVDYAIFRAAKEKVGFSRNRGYLRCAVGSIVKEFRETVGRQYLTQRKLRGGTVEYFDPLSDKMVVGAIESAKLEETKKKRSELVRRQEDSYEIRRQLCREEATRRGLPYPDLTSFDLTAMSDFVFEECWAKRLSQYTHSKRVTDGKKVTREAILERALRILRERKAVPFGMA